MQRLTFNGYLERYIKSLSQNNTTSITKLANEAKVNRRLNEPLLLYALCVGKVDLLLKATEDNDVRSQYSEIVSRYTLQTLLATLEAGDKELDRNYHKVYNSYVCRRDMPETHGRSKALIYNKVKRLQQSKRITNYRVYTDLRLNPGNINAYLKTGDVTKVSRNVARRILVYLEEA